jgi:hypothetical protein
MSTSLARAAQNLYPAFYELDILIRIQASDGTYGQRIGPIESTTVAITPSVPNKITQLSALRGRTGQANASVSVPNEAPKIGLAFADSANADLVRLALKGETTSLTQASSTATNTVMAVPYLGSWLRLGHRNIQTTGFSGKLANDTALVANTDYVIDATWLKSGLVWIPATSNIPAGNACKWSYTYYAVSGTITQGDKLSSMTIDLVGFGKNLVRDSAGVQQELELEVWQVDLDSNATFNFRSEGQTLTFDFTGTLITPSGKDSPYEIRYPVFAAA